MSPRIYDLTTNPSNARAHGNKTVDGANRRHTVSIYLPEDVIDSLDRAAQRNGRTRSAEAREAILEYLQEKP